MENEKLYIKNCMKAFGKKHIAYFGTPHNKRDKNFTKHFACARRDIAGLPFADNYKDPKERIRKSRIRVARILGSKESFYMTNGIMGGIYAMIYAVKDRGVSMIINRNADPAVYEALKMFGIEPIILNQNLKRGILLPPTLDEIDKALQYNRRAIGVLLTYPDKYGICLDLAEVRERVSKAGKLLLLDCSYGSHFRFDDQTVYAGKYADVWLDGVYKTMPALNQGVILNVGNQDILENIRYAVNAFRAEIPSYEILASLEYAVNYMSVDGMQKLEKLREEVMLLKKRLASVNYSVNNNSDFTCLVVDFKGVDISAKLADKYLYSKRIYSDFNDGRYIVFRLSPSNGFFGVKMLEYYLKKLTRIKRFQHTYADRFGVTFGVKEKSYITSVSSLNTEWVEIKDSADRIAAVNVAIETEDFLLLTAGEKILPETVETLLHQEKLFGTKDGKVLVLKERNEEEKPLA